MKKFLMVMGLGLVLCGCESEYDKQLDAQKIATAKEATRSAVSKINFECAASALKAKLDGTVDICADGITVAEAQNMMGQFENVEILDVKYENSKITYLKIKDSIDDIIIEYNGDTYELIK